MRFTKVQLILGVVLILAAIHFVSSSFKKAPVQYISQPGLAQAVKQTDLERFPGEAEWMKKLNHDSIRSTIHLHRGSRYADDLGLYYLNQPSYYGQADLLQYLQEQGVDVYQLLHSDPELQRWLKADPETYRKLKDLGWLD